MAEYYVGQINAEKTLGHGILLGAYRIYKTGGYQKGIHSADLLEELELCIPKWIDQNGLASHLSAYDDNIKTKEMK